MKKFASLFLILTLVFVITVTSCAPAPNDLPVNPYSQSNTTTPNLVNSSTYPVITDLDPGSIQYFSEIKQALNLTPDELNLLKQNGFMVTDRLAWDRFLDSYAWIYAKDLPVLITTDSILHSVHQSYDDLLTDIERTVLIPKLGSMLSNLQTEINKTRSEIQDESLKDLYADVSIYLSVAISLLNGSEPTDPKTKELYSLAVKADSFSQITLFGSQRKVDFSRFKPRGHYLKGLELEQYFRAMNWLAQIDFRFVEFDPQTNQPVLRKTQVIAAAILRDTLISANQETEWDEIDSLLVALVGASDNSNLNDLEKFLADIKAASPAEVAKYDEKQMLEQLLNNDYGYQRITGQLLSRDPANFSPEPVSRPISFMLMGQRFAIDSYVLGNLVYDRMIKNGKPIERALPATLDVMYTLGNNQALSHLQEELSNFGYDRQLAVLRAEVDSLSSDFWKTSFYNQWLGMIKSLNTDTTGKKYPQSMRTSAWADKMLQTQLASWAQLRHDNILYVKQSYTMSVACEYPEGYVEPYPEFYRAFQAYAQSGFEVLSGLAGADNDNWEFTRQKALKYLKNVISTSEKLTKLAEKELALQDFDPEEKAFLKDVVVRHDNDNNMCGAPPYIWNGWYVDLFYNQDDNPALIADIHTNPNRDGPLAPVRVLHAATGAVIPICLAAETDEGSTLYVGPSFTYYDIIEQGYPPVRLTDEEWRARLNGQNQPDHPDWTKSFLISDKNKPETLTIDSKSR